MRIISGVAKGRKLKMIRGLLIRPMLDSIKESIFNIIRNRIIGSNVLDLYAGSGSLCFEAISRGAKEGVLVDKSNLSCRLIKENVDLLGFKDMVKIIKRDCLSAIKFLNENMYKFKIIFSDPPFNNNLSEKTLKVLAEYDILNSDCLVIARHHKKEIISSQINCLKLSDRRIYGDSIVSFYKIV